jgi:hypothetical protein
LYVGGNAYYAGVIRPQDVQQADPAGITLADFAFGGEARLLLGSIWGSAVGVYLPGNQVLPHRLHILLDAGLAIDLLFLRFGVGLGPDFGLALGNEGSRPYRAGANLRLTGDLMLGDLSVGLSWVSRIEFTRESIANAFRNPYGFLGVTLLTKL